MWFLFLFWFFSKLVTTLIVATLADHILGGSNTDVTTHVWFQNILKNWEVDIFLVYYSIYLGFIMCGK